MRKVVFSLVAVMICFSMNSAHARNVWRECGIGGMIFQNTGWAAIISNVIWDLGSTATTSNVSSADMCEGKSASTAKFINETYANLEEETALGTGEHLVTLLNVLGCDVQAHNAIIGAVRSDLQQSMSSPAYEGKSKIQKAEGYYNSLMNNVESKFAKECHVI